MFGLIAAGSPNFGAIATFAALWSVGVGGNLPVDSAIFLEFLPASHQYLLTVLSVDWALAQVFATLVAWPLLGNLTCQQSEDGVEETCTKSQNMGWRYFIIVMGALAMVMFFLRFVCFTIFESPKYLMGRGRDEEAVSVVHEVARRNGRTTALTIEDLKACEQLAGTRTWTSTTTNPVTSTSTPPPTSTSKTAALQRSLSHLSFSHLRSLFHTPRLALSTTFITLIWALIGLSFPLYNAFLPYTLATRGASFGDSSTYLTYRNALIIAVLGVPGCLLGGLLVELPRVGRKGTLSLSTILTGVFLFSSTTALNSTALLGWNCAYNFCANIMYAVLYAYTPEIFPTRDRGTGNAVTAGANRVFGVMAPIVAMFADLRTSVPVYVSGALFVAAGVLVWGLPFESRGRASM